jgi:AcrR family transcriptional regulator
MDDVAREIGKRRSSLYYYYKNKEEILDAAIDVEMREILKEIAQAVDKAHELEQKISAYFMTRLKISQKRKVFYSMIDRGVNAGEADDYIHVRITIHNRFRQLEIPLLRSVLDYGIEKRQLRAMHRKEQDVLIFVLLSSMQGFKKEMALKQRFASIEPAIAMMIHLVIQGFKP